MKIYLEGMTGGIGSAIGELLSKENELTDTYFFDEYDWLILAQGVMNEDDVYDTLYANLELGITVTKDLLSRVKQGVIYISSTAGITGNSKFPVYSASKAALNTYAVSMQKAHPELQFYALCPGPTNTKMWQNLGLEGTPQEPVEVAKAIKRIIAGEFKGHVIITVRNGEITCL